MSEAMQYDYAEIKIGDTWIRTEVTDRVLVRSQTFEASAIIRRKDWDRFKRDVSRRWTPEIIPLGTLGGRRAVAIDRVRERRRVKRFRSLTELIAVFGG
jgi:hypothetical protein